jgi:hypothetical protein
LRCKGKYIFQTCNIYTIKKPLFPFSFIKNLPPTLFSYII